MNENRIKSLIQLNSIIGVLPEEKKKNIPIGILREIENAQLDGYIFKYDYSKDINEEAKEMLFNIYINYLATKDELSIINDKIKIIEEEMF